MGICDVKTVSEILSAVFGFLAAGFWFYASWVSRGSFLNTPMLQFDISLRDQARFNAIAAFCAGISALLQIAVTSFMPVCRAFG
jgi:hypothetical protein